MPELLNGREVPEDGTARNPVVHLRWDVACRPHWEAAQNQGGEPASGPELALGAAMRAGKTMSPPLAVPLNRKTRSEQRRGSGGGRAAQPASG